jgi:D-sedoheptulose 7-phosphate isomerase
MIQSFIQTSIDTKSRLFNDTQCISLIQSLIDDSIKCLKNNGKIILCGNGGSFSDAQHISAEFTSRFMFDRDSLPSIALGCNSSTMSAIGNDYGFDQSFSRELSSIGSPDDIFIPISTSGNSPNILKAIQTANEKKLTIYGLTGNKKGEMISMCTCIKVPSSSTPRIQESHILIGHIVCEMVEAAICQKIT